MPVLAWWAFAAGSAVVGFGAGVAVSDGVRDAARIVAVGAGGYVAYKLIKEMKS